jgi:hypothetical protein
MSDQDIEQASAIYAKGDNTIHRERGRTAFVPMIDPQVGRICLGIATEGTPTVRSIAISSGLYPRWDIAERAAKRMNEEVGLSPEEAREITASSLAGALTISSPAIHQVTEFEKGCAVSRLELLRLIEAYREHAHERTLAEIAVIALEDEESEEQRAIDEPQRKIAGEALQAATAKERVSMRHLAEFVVRATEAGVL